MWPVNDDKLGGAFVYTMKIPHGTQAANQQAVCVWSNVVHKTTVLCAI